MVGRVMLAFHCPKCGMEMVEPVEPFGYTVRSCPRCHAMLQIFLVLRELKGD